MTASLSGEFSYLDKNSGQVSRRIDGHSKAITALAVTHDDTLFTGSYDGRVFGWNYGSEGDHTTAERIEGDGPKNQVTALSSKDNAIFSIAMDDTIRQGSISDNQFSEKIISTGSLPSSLSVSNEKITVVSTNETVLIYNEALEKIGELESPGFTPSVAEISPNSKTVFVGGQDNKVRVFELNDGKLTLAGELSKNLGNITSLAIHPELNLIAVGDSVGKIFIYDTETKETVLQRWVFHSSRITSLNWSKCGVYLVSGSIDTNIYVWDRENPFKKIAIKNAHVDAVNSVRFLNNTSALTVVSVGQDAAVRVWEVAF